MVAMNISPVTVLTIRRSSILLCGTPAVSGVPAYAVGAFFSLAGTANPIPISKTQVNSKGFNSVCITLKSAKRVSGCTLYQSCRELLSSIDSLSHDRNQSHRTHLLRTISVFSKY